MIPRKKLSKSDATKPIIIIIIACHGVKQNETDKTVRLTDRQTAILKDLNTAGKYRRLFMRDCCVL